MNTISKEDAFSLLDNHQYGIPFEAIEFLYHHSTDEEIIGKIQHSFEKAYNFSAEIKKDYHGPELWYAIVAEKHLSISLLDPIIKLITKVSQGSDFLDEQISVLIGLMGKNHGSIAVEKVLTAIENSLEDKSGEDYPYLYLFDILFYADPIQQEEIITRILEHPNNAYFAPFAITICYAGMTQFIPKIKELIKAKDQKAADHLFELDYLIPELEENIKKLKSDTLKNSKAAVPYFEQRGPWKEYYQELTDLFEERIPNQELDDIKSFLSSSTQDIVPTKHIQKVGRNEPCPCGSGKKYKKCCLKKR